MDPDSLAEIMNLVYCFILTPQLSLKPVRFYKYTKRIVILTPSLKEKIYWLSRQA